MFLYTYIFFGKNNHTGESFDVEDSRRLIEGNGNFFVLKVTLEKDFAAPIDFFEAPSFLLTFCLGVVMKFCRL